MKRVIIDGAISTASAWNPKVRMGAEPATAHRQLSADERQASCEHLKASGLMVAGLILLLLLHACAAASAGGAEAGADSGALEKRLESIRKRRNLPSLAAAVIQGDKTVAVAAVGVRKLGDRTRVTVDDQYHLGSCTKSMTATLAARLVEKHVIAWNTTLAEVFPEMAKEMNPKFRRVTLEQLLSHRGGVAGFTDDENTDAELWKKLCRQTGSPKQQRLMLVQGVLTKEPAVEPGREYVYSNAGYAIAGAMLEKATADTWEHLMQRELFLPLGMKSAGFGAPATPGTVDQPWGHEREGNEMQPVAPGPTADNPPAISPAGRVHVSLPDWAKYVAMHLRAARGETNFLSRSSIRKLHTPVSGSEYSLGWMVVERDWAGGKALTHGGTNGRHFAIVWLAPARDFAVAVATNVGGEASFAALDETVAELIQTYLLTSSQK